MVKSMGLSVVLIAIFANCIQVYSYQHEKEFDLTKNLLFIIHVIYADIHLVNSLKIEFQNLMILEDLQGDGPKYKQSKILKSKIH